MEIYLCTDNNEGGIEAIDRLKDILNENGYENIFRLAPRNKDFNEDLKELNGIVPLPAVPHRRKEMYLSEVEQLEYTAVNPNRAVDALRYAIYRNEYFSASKVALSISADILSKANGKPRQIYLKHFANVCRKATNPTPKEENALKAGQLEKSGAICNISFAELSCDI